MSFISGFLMFGFLGWVFWCVLVEDAQCQAHREPTEEAIEQEPEIETIFIIEEGGKS